MGFRLHKQNSVNFCNTRSAFGPDNLDSNLDRRGWLVLSGTYFKFSDKNPSVILYTCVLHWWLPLPCSHNRTILSNNLLLYLICHLHHLLISCVGLTKNMPSYMVRKFDCIAPRSKVNHPWMIFRKGTYLHFKKVHHCTNVQRKLDGRNFREVKMFEVKICSKFCDMI